MGALDRIDKARPRRPAALEGEVLPRPSNLAISLDQWAEYFRFDGLGYPIVQTTMGTLDEERPPQDLAQVWQQSSPLFALMLARLQVFSQARFQWTRFSAGEPGELFGSAELSVLERPWPGGTTADLLARMEQDDTSAGNAYIRRLRRRREDRLVRLRPRWVVTVMGSMEDAEHPAEAGDVELLGYAYLPGGVAGRMVLLSPGEVAHYAPIPDPDGVFVGMSWITATLREVFADNAAVTHKDRFFRNAATPNLAIKFDPSITIDAVKAFKELLEAEHKGAWNAYKTLYLGGGADPVAVGKDFQEMDFTNLQGKAESRMAANAGVPPSWVGFSEGLEGSALNAGNFTAARRRYGDGTMQHLWANAASSLETLLTKPPDRNGRPDETASLWFATRGIPFLSPDVADQAVAQAKEAETITALVREGFTAESAVDAVKNHDWSRLKHSGLVSVQLQPPGAAAPSPNGAPVPNGNGRAAAALIGR